jgi:hypothetical protein
VFRDASESHETMRVNLKKVKLYSKMYAYMDYSDLLKLPCVHVSDTVQWNRVHAVKSDSGRTVRGPDQIDTHPGMVLHDRLD